MASLIGLMELLAQTKQTAEFSANLFEAFTLATLIYYPDEKLEELEKDGPMPRDWYRITLFRLLQVCKLVATKYTRSKVRKKMPETFAYVIDELLHADTEDTKEQYYGEIIHSITRTGMAEKFIIITHLSLAIIILTFIYPNTIFLYKYIFQHSPAPNILLKSYF